MRGGGCCCGFSFLFNIWGVNRVESCPSTCASAVGTVIGKVKTDCLFFAFAATRIYERQNAPFRCPTSNLPVYCCAGRLKCAITIITTTTTTTT